MPRQDVHMERPEVAVSVRRVGVTGIRVPIQFIFLGDQPSIVVPIFEAYVDLPAHLKGIHPSRSYEATVELFTRHAGRLHRLEDLCAEIAEELLRRHDYASEAEVKASAEVVYERRTPETGSRTFESCTLHARALAHRQARGGVKLRRWIGVTVSGLTACPCAQELLREAAGEELASALDLPEEKAQEVVEQLPIGSHMQRSHGSLTVELPPGHSLDALQLVKVVEGAMSTATYELLKRPDEAAVVRAALDNPRFVEDSIRHMLLNFLKAFPQLPDHTQLHLTQRSEESIHRHDLVAEQTITLGEARRQIRENSSKEA